MRLALPLRRQSSRTPSRHAVRSVARIARAPRRGRLLATADEDEDEYEEEEEEEAEEDEEEEADAESALRMMLPPSSRRQCRVAMRWA